MVARSVLNYWNSEYLSIQNLPTMVIKKGLLNHQQREHMSFRNLNIKAFKQNLTDMQKLKTTSLKNKDNSLLSLEQKRETKNKDQKMKVTQN